MSYILSAIKKTLDSGFQNSDEKTGNYLVEKRGNEYSFVYLNKKHPRFDEQKLHYATYKRGSLKMHQDLKQKYDPDWNRIKRLTLQAIKKAGI